MTETKAVKKSLTQELCNEWPFCLKAWPLVKQTCLHQRGSFLQAFHFFPFCFLRGNTRKLKGQTWSSFNWINLCTRNYQSLVNVFLCKHKHATCTPGLISRLIQPIQGEGNEPKEHASSQTVNLWAKNYSRSPTTFINGCLTSSIFFIAHLLYLHCFIPMCWAGCQA